MLEDIGLFKQVWRWFYSHKQVYSTTRTTVCCFRDKMMSKIDHHWPLICSGCVKLGNLLVIVLMQWRNCCMRGLKSLLRLSSAALLLIMWSCFLSLTSISCLAYVLLTLGAAGAGVRYLGYSPGLFIVGLFGILILWMYGNFWITGILFIVGVFKFRVGWIGIFLSVNLAFLSNDLLNHLLQGCDSASEGIRMEEEKEFESIYSIPTEETENVQSCKSTFVKPDTSSVDEMKRIMDSLDHYEALGLPRVNFPDAGILKKGVSTDLKLFAKIPMEVQDRMPRIIDLMNQDEFTAQNVAISMYGYAQTEPRTRLGGARTAVNIIEPGMGMDGLSMGARWSFQSPPKVILAVAYFYFRLMVIVYSSWKYHVPLFVLRARFLTCQNGLSGMTCRPNTHRPSFHVNMVGLEKMSRSNSSRFPWDLDAQMMEEDEEEFELWLQQALASGLFSEASKRRKSWSPFKLPQKKYWRKST
ncbi:hypothetical protein MKW92_014160 [Papaver armeniacum]|nr:hypothetical protein MKW92_014160 [Papaver armeniacum]